MKLAHLVFLAAAAAMTALAAAAANKEAGAAAMADNPFSQPSTLPFEFPPFDRIHDADYAPAYEAGMRAQLKEVAAIAHDPQPASFENTIVPLERSGQLLDRVDKVFSNLNSCNTDPEMQKVDTEMAPRLAAHEDAIYLDAALWARVDALYEKRASLDLDPESLQLLTRYHTRFVRAGARLSAPDQKRLRA
ncbi:MAG: dipeptidyl carboxypeptidase II, partial [Steroidobacteraceae bacterium]